MVVIMLEFYSSMELFSSLMVAYPLTETELI